MLLYIFKDFILHRVKWKCALSYVLFQFGLISVFWVSPENFFLLDSISVSKYDKRSYILIKIIFPEYSEELTLSSERDLRINFDLQNKKWGR